MFFKSDKNFPLTLNKEYRQSQAPWAQLPLEMSHLYLFTATTTFTMDNFQQNTFPMDKLTLIKIGFRAAVSCVTSVQIPESLIYRIASRGQFHQHFMSCFCNSRLMLPFLAYSIGVKVRFNI